MFGWLKSMFGSEPEEQRIVPPPLPSKVKKAEKIVSKKISKKTAAKKEVSKTEEPKKETVKTKVVKKETSKTKAKTPKNEEVIQPIVDTEIVASKKKGSRSKKNTG